MIVHHWEEAWKVPANSWLPGMKGVDLRMVRLSDQTRWLTTHDIFNLTTFVQDFLYGQQSEGFNETKPSVIFSLLMPMERESPQIVKSTAFYENGRPFHVLGRRPDWRHRTTILPMNANDHYVCGVIYGQAKIVAWYDSAPTKYTCKSLRRVSRTVK